MTLYKYDGTQSVIFTRTSTQAPFKAVPGQTYDLLTAPDARFSVVTAPAVSSPAVERTADAGGDTPSSPPAESDSSTPEEKEV